LRACFACGTHAGLLSYYYDDRNYRSKRQADFTHNKSFGLASVVVSVTGKETFVPQHNSTS